ncbi:Pentatricopeptide repeat-containing protein [Cyphellophora attinorum]|uniref:Pentatricopeptide repeat-containing protein n=1 Tax=Cyphellophora attinorum TaxID=1664694 RepID=A0A0N1H8U8_9EURO|nr:Pentatricopeptide repeat-containing protein [Phialophora attinorum]KPI43570.1 Pentatricopeptide repeat-containing protein [Phialophora attinorum]
MLERAAAYIDPVTQVIIQRGDVPFRSSRLLTRGFFRHGAAAAVDTPPWWPLYLETVRQVPYGQSKQCLKTKREAVVVPKHSRRSRPRCVQSTTSAKATRSSIGSRTYSAGTATAPQRGSNGQVVGDRAEAEHNEHYEAEDEEDQVGDQKDKIMRQTQHLYDNPSEGIYEDVEVNESRMDGAREAALDPSHPASVRNLADMQSKSAAQIELETLLTLDASRRAAHNRKSSGEHADAIWKAFIALPEQETYASRVLSHLAASAILADWRRAPSAFNMIPLENRVDRDYDMVVRAAFKMRRATLAVQMCKEASELGLAGMCRQTALVKSLGLGLFKTAVRVWNECFGDVHLHPESGRNSLPSHLVGLLDQDSHLPELIYKILNRLKATNTRLTAQERGCLMYMAQELSWRVIASGRIMSIITPEGLWRIFDNLAAAQLLEHKMLATAITTLASEGRVPRARHDLAIAIYRNSRLRFPDERVNAHVLNGLVRLCYRAEEKYEVFQYLFDEMRSLPKLEGRTLPGRAAYYGALRALSLQGNVAAVSSLYEDFITDHGALRSCGDLIPALYVHATVGDVAATKRVFDSVQTKYGFAPNIACWNVLILAHARSEEPIEAFSVFDHMAKQNIKPDAYTFSTLISIVAKKGDVTNVLDLLQKAMQHDLKDIRPMLASLVHAYCLNDDLESAKKLLANVHTFDMIGSPVNIWNQLLKHYAYRADVDAIKSTHRRMVSAGVELDQYSYGCLMAAFIRKGNTEAARNLLQDLHLDSKVVATPFLYSLILVGFEREGNRDMVRLLYQEMEDRFPRMTPSANLAMLKAEVRAGFSKEAARYDRETTPGRMHRPNLTEALNLLEQLGQTSTTTQPGRAASGPQPGFVREPAADAVPAIYSSAVAESLATSGQLPKPGLS